MRSFLASFLIIACMLLQTLEAKNPVDSPTFDEILKEFIGDQKFIFDDENIKIKVPSFADNPVQVPIFVDGKKIKDAKEMIIFADLNPTPLVIRMKLDHFAPIFATNIKVAQETGLRALILDSKGVWHVGSANILSNGGGCDVSSQAMSDSGDFSKNLGKVKGNRFKKGEYTRLKASIFHPMETGFLFGTSEFYINKVIIKDEKQELANITLSSVVSENPRFIFETKVKSASYKFHFLDNDGNEFDLDIQ